MARLILDTGALIAHERADPGVRAWLEEARRRDEVPVVSAVSLAEAWRSAKQVRLAQLLNACAIVTVSERIARTAGESLASTAAGAIDAIVCATAVEAGGGIILTSDPGDLGRLAAGRPELRIERI